MKVGEDFSPSVCFICQDLPYYMGVDFENKEGCHFQTNDETL